MSFKIFDAFRDRQFVDYSKLEAYETIKEHLVPVLYKGIYSRDKVLELVNGKSLLGNNIKEGIVIRTDIELWRYPYGRMIMKCISDEYLLKS